MNGKVFELEQGKELYKKGISSSKIMGFAE